MTITLSVNLTLTFQHVDYTECVQLMARADFRACILEQCFRISCVRTQGRFASGSARFSPVSPLNSSADGQRAAGQVDKLFAATELALLQRVRRALGEAEQSVPADPSEEAAQRRKRGVSELCAGLTQYLVVLKQLPVPVPIPPDYQDDIVRFVGLYIQVSFLSTSCFHRLHLANCILEILPSQSIHFGNHFQVVEPRSSCPISAVPSKWPSWPPSARRAALPPPHSRPFLPHEPRGALGIRTGALREPCLCPSLFALLL